MRIRRRNPWNATPWRVWLAGKLDPQSRIRQSDADYKAAHWNERMQIAFDQLAARTVELDILQNKVDNLTDWNDNQCRLITGVQVAWTDDRLDRAEAILFGKEIA